MSKGKSFGLTLGLIGVITAAIVGFVLMEDASARKNYTAEAEPVGLVATPVEWDEGSEDGGIQHGHTLTYSWVDSGNGVHTEAIEQVTWYDEQARYKVCYDPANPEDHRFYKVSVKCGGAE